VVVIGEQEARHGSSVFSIIAAEQISTLAVVPTMFAQLLAVAAKNPDAIRSLKHVTVAGARLTATLRDQSHRFLPNTTLSYSYGTSETGPVSVRKILPEESFSPNRVGSPEPGVQVFVLDGSGHIVQPNCVGEICVSSPHMSVGYFNRPDLTALRFVQFKQSPEPSGMRVFRTGDLGRVMENGEIELQGRINRNVKVRGLFVQLEDVEQAIESHPSVESAVVEITDRLDRTRLVSYVVTKSDQEVTVEMLRSHVAAKLRDHMVPSAFVIVESFALGRSGKIDLTKLPSYTERPKLGCPFVPPQTVCETVIAEVWSRLLDVSEVGIDDHFLDLGGDSLFATQCVLELEARFGIGVGEMTLHDHPTIRSLATLLGVGEGS